MATAPQFDSPQRRSTRVATDIVIEVKGEKFAYAGETVVVNFHGGLIRTMAQLEVGAAVMVFVHRTGKAARARVVFAPPDNPCHYGIELDEAENIWGLDPSPEDWEA
jgi:hypothetical protein